MSKSKIPANASATEFSLVSEIPDLQIAPFPGVGFEIGESVTLENLPPAPDLTGLDPLFITNTRFNEDRTHRFTLFRHWGNPDNYCVFIFMNPSCADERVLDSTVLKACKFARRWGYGGLYILNALSVRLTASGSLAKVPLQNHPDNDRWIRDITRGASLVVIGWGNPGHASGRGPAVEAILREATAPERVKCFGFNKNGSPVHPLYQRDAAVPIPYW